MRLEPIELRALTMRLTADLSLEDVESVVREAGRDWDDIEKPSSKQLLVQRLLAAAQTQRWLLDLLDAIAGRGDWNLETTKLCDTLANSLRNQILEIQGSGGQPWEV